MSEDAQRAEPAMDTTFGLDLSAIRSMHADMARIVSPDGIDEAMHVTLGGARQWIAIRGQDRRAPLLIFLHGGPGGAISDIAYMFQRPWEDYFTVVQWDQRGFGRSAVDGARLEGTLNLEQYVADLVELIELLRGRFGQDKVLLLGQSWGTALCLELAHRRPDLLHAIASIGQLVDQRGNFEETRRLLTGHARSNGEAELFERLEALGPLPPGTDRQAWVEWVGFVQTEMVRRGFSWHNFDGPGDDWNSRALAGMAVSPALAEPPPQAEPPFTRGPVTPHEEIGASIAHWNARDAVGTRFEVPVLIMSGAHDWQTPVTLARSYYEEIDAPWKAFVEFPHSAHVVTLEEPGRLIVTLVGKLLPAAEGRTPDGVSTRSGA